VPRIVADIKRHGSQSVAWSCGLLDRVWDLLQSRPRTFLLIVCGLLMIQIGPLWYPTLDSTNYLSASRSLTSEGPIKSLDSPRVDIPLGYPILISPAFLFGERPFVALSIIQFCLALGVTCGVYRWAQRQIPDAAVLVTCLVMVNAGVWLYYRRTLKEIAFMAFSIWTVNVLHDVLRAPDRRSLLRSSVLAVLLSCFLVTIRYAGIVFPAAFGGLLLWRAVHRQCAPRLATALILLVACPSAAVLLGQVAYHRSMAVVHGGRDYLQGFQSRTSTATQTTGDRLLASSQMRLHGIARVVAPGMLKTDAALITNHPAVAVGELVVLLMIVCGCWKLARKHDLLTLSFPLYMALYIAWPFDSGGRFLVPMAPLLIGSLVVAWMPYVAGRRLHIVGLMAHVTVALGYWLFIDLPRAQEINGQWATVDRIVQVVASNPGRLECEQRELQPLLQLAGDKCVLYSHSWHSNSKNRPQWLLLSAGQPVPDAFGRPRTIDGYQILERRARPTASDRLPRTAQSLRRTVN